MSTHIVQFGLHLHCISIRHVWFLFLLNFMAHQSWLCVSNECLLPVQATSNPWPHLHININGWFPTTRSLWSWDRQLSYSGFNVWLPLSYIDWVPQRQLKQEVAQDRKENIRVDKAIKVIVKIVALLIIMKYQSNIWMALIRHTCSPL